MQRSIETYACLGFVAYLTNKTVRLSFGRSIEEYKIFFVAAAILLLFAAILSLRKSDRVFRVILYPATLFAGGILGRLQSCFVCGFSLDYVWEAIPFTLTIALWAAGILFLLNPRKKITRSRIAIGIVLFVLSLLYLNFEMLIWQRQLEQTGDASPGPGSRVIQTEAMDYETLNRKQQRNILVVGSVIIVVSGGWWIQQRRHRKNSHDHSASGCT